MCNPWPNYAPFYSSYSPPLLASAQQQDSLSQATEKETHIENLLEFFQDDLEDSFDLTDLQYELEYRYDHPLDLNAASEADLRRSRLLPEQELQALIKHREQFGPLYAIEELQSIEGWDLDFIENILPFVAVDGDITDRRFSFQEIMKNGERKLWLRGTGEFDPYDSSQKNNFPGSPLAIYARYEYRFLNLFSFGFLGEKDAGEPLLSYPYGSGFDFLSGHLYYNDEKRQAALGDFQVQMGQGLVLWSGFALGKTPDGIVAPRTAKGLLPYRSTNENMFLRGTAANIRLGDWQILAFYSRKWIDASALDTGQGFSSFAVSGLHRTPRERAAQNRIREQLFGGEISYEWKRLKVGLTGMEGRYGEAFIRQNLPYNALAWHGRVFRKGSVHYTFSYKNALFYGESALSERGAQAHLHGLTLAMHPKLDATLIGRRYDPGFPGLYSDAFGETGEASNENGLYMGLQLRPTRAWQIGAYLDRYRHPWLRYRVDAPSSGADGLVDAIWKIRKTWEINLRYREEWQERNPASTNPALSGTVPLRRTKWRAHVQYQLSPALELRSRFEASLFREQQLPVQEGFVIFLEARWSKMGSPWALSGRWAFFDAPAYETRISAYEHDVPFAYSVPSYYGQGQRAYVMMQYKAGRSWQLHLRLAQTMGTREATQFSETEVKVQAAWGF